jgi:LysM repeat protein
MYLRTWNNGISRRLLTLFFFLSLLGGADVFGQGLRLSAPSHNAIVIGERVAIEGRLEGASHVYVQGQSVAVSNHKFRVEVPCLKGKQRIPVMAVNFKTERIEETSITVFCVSSYKDVASLPVLKLTTVLGSAGAVSSAYFQPDRWITKAELMWTLVKLGNERLVTPRTPSFKDVLPSDWHYSFIETAVKRHGIRGENSVDFAPDGLVSRAVFFRILSRFEGVTSLPNSKPITPDLSRTFWGNRYLGWASRSHLIPSKWLETNMVYPYRPVTRREAFEILAQLPSVQFRLAKVFRPDRIAKVVSSPKRRVVAHQRVIPKVVSREIPKASFDITKTWAGMTGSIQKMTDRLPKINRAKDPKYTEYRIQRGDTLPIIARRYMGSSKEWERLAGFNDLRIRKKEHRGRIIKICTIVPGQVIKIPSK